MATAQVKYFSGTQEIQSVFPLKNSSFAAIGGERSKHNRFDSFARLVGKAANGAIMPVTRKVEYKSNPSLHECGPKCRTAKGHTCECSCGGEFHGADA